MNGLILFPHSKIEAAIVAEDGLLFILPNYRCNFRLILG
jgi:hypothetical protein